MQNIIVQNYGKVMLFNLLGNTKLWQGTSKVRRRNVQGTSKIHPRYIQDTSKQHPRNVKGLSKVGDD